jgi:hypothetical protein
MTDETKEPTEIKTEPTTLRVQVDGDWLDIFRAYSREWGIATNQVVFLLACYGVSSVGMFNDMIQAAQEGKMPGVMPVSVMTEEEFDALPEEDKAKIHQIRPGVWEGQGAPKGPEKEEA